MSANQILVVEDERLVALGIKNDLEQFGYQISGIAASATEAIDKVNQTMPELVLMDIHLKGGGDGVDAARQIYDQYGIPVIFLTAFADQETITRASGTGAFGYLVKPYEQRELQTTIEMAIAKHRAEIQLEETRRWLAAVYNGISDAVIAVDPNLKVRFMNRASEALSGWPKEQGIGLPPARVYQVVQADGPVEWETLISEAVDKRCSIELSAPTWLLSRDGLGQPVEGGVSPIYGPRGDQLGTVVVLRNISGRLELERLRQQAEERLRRDQQLDAVSRLAGGIAQHLNNHLTTILNNASLALDPNHDPLEIKDVLERIARAAQHATTVVRRLNLYATFAGRHSGPLPQVQLESIVHHALDEIEPRLNANTQLHYHVQDNLWPVAADELLVVQALLELAANAKDAMPKGGELTLELENVVFSASDLASNPDGQVGDFVRLRVRDTGCGMRPTVRCHAAELCFTTKDDGITIGLGVPLVYAVVAHHHGWIDYDSHVSQGTTFDLYFPRHGADLNVALDRLPSTPKRQGPVPTVLLCESDPMVLDVGRRILEGQGYEVILATDGVQAVDEFRKAKETIDLAILDLNLPRLSAYAVLEKLVETDPHVKVIFAGGFFSEDLTGTNGHTMGVIAKPYRQEDLVRFVQRVLGSGRGKPDVGA